MKIELDHKEVSYAIAEYCAKRYKWIKEAWEEEDLQVYIDTKNITAKVYRRSKYPYYPYE